LELTKRRAIAWIVRQQEQNGSWSKDEPANNLQGGRTALAVLALLENGLTGKDATVKKGLESLRRIRPQGNYVVSLQTQVLCRANQKKDENIIKTNVKWLASTVLRDGQGKLTGWSYGFGQRGAEGDNSNTRYAVSGLYAAHKAAFKVERMELWEDVREYFLRTQLVNGGWGYTQTDPR